MAEEEKKEAKKLAPKKPNAKKRDMQNVKKRAQGRIVKKEINTATSVYKKGVKEDKTGAQGLLNRVFSLLDKAVKKGVFKRNKAARDKSKLHTLLK
ncbi:MAG: 30S ribosomal protein S20 [Chlamydiae bacterium]|nr:30S ribosomal protein S20 [Chlamydiota bacterium]